METFTYSLDENNEPPSAFCTGTIVCFIEME